MLTNAKKSIEVVMLPINRNSLIERELVLVYLYLEIKKVYLCAPINAMLKSWREENPKWKLNAKLVWDKMYVNPILKTINSTQTGKEADLGNVIVEKETIWYVVSVAEWRWWVSEWWCNRQFAAQWENDVKDEDGWGLSRADDKCLLACH